MFPRRFVSMLALVVLAGAAACAGRRAAGRRAAGRCGWAGVRRPPAGLDSAGAAQWLAVQRRACRGRLAVVYTEMPVADSGSHVFRSRTWLDGVACYPR